MTEPPSLRVVAGGLPSDEEIAALTAVVTRQRSTEGDRQPAAVSRWQRAGWLPAARQAIFRRPR